LNEEIFNELLYLNTQPLDHHEDVPRKLFNTKTCLITLKDLDTLPDGAVRFKEANSQKLSYTLLINDLRIQEYHRYE